MTGCARRQRRAMAMAMAGGWHSANFGRAGRELRTLDHYMRRFDRADTQTADEAAAIWQGFADRGLVTIREVPKEV